MELCGEVASRSKQDVRVNNSLTFSVDIGLGPYRPCFDVKVQSNLLRKNEKLLRWKL